jgi:putative membrane protein
MMMRSTPRLKALVLILMGVFFAAILVNGKLYYYIGPRFSWLALLAVCLFILLAGAYNLVSRDVAAQKVEALVGEPDHDHGSVWPIAITAIPLVLAVVVPAHPLGADAISTRGISTGFSGRDQAAQSNDSSARTVLDWAQAISANPDPAALDGQAADAIGFVYRDPRFGKDQFMLTRFAITCCVADALAIGVVVQSEKAPQLSVDSWVRVKGAFKAGMLDNVQLSVLVAQDVAPIQPPDQPYLYP